MLATFAYNRERAYLYAKRWALARNPLFNDYSPYGGNCTNFASQCLLAGAPVMNYEPVYGWFYRSDADRAAAWTGVPFFYRFLTENAGEGPYATESDALEVGDFIQLGTSEGDFYHTLVVVGAEGGEYLVAAQSDDYFLRPLSEYRYDRARFLHIEGVRVLLSDDAAVFYDLLEGRALPPSPLYVSAKSTPAAT